MSGEVTAGEEIDAWCTRCKLVLNHIVVAMLGDKPKRVQCLTCEGQHDYRAAGPAASKPKAAAATKRKAAPVVPLPDEATAPGRDYAMGESFTEGEIVRHPTYGRGRVNKVRGNKIDVEFGEGAKTLAHALKA